MATLELQKGQWRLRNSSKDIHACPLRNACPGGTNYSAGECAEGYAGATCANCASSHYLYRGECLPCESSDGKALLWMPSALVLSLACLAAMWKLIRRARNGSATSTHDSVYATSKQRLAAKRRRRLKALGKHRRVLFVKSKLAISAYQIVKQAGPFNSATCTPP